MIDYECYLNFRLQRQTQTNRPELRRDLKEAVKITKNGLCFLKITEQC